jgi:ADP-L-glycero-D-manno-heptose 6-epimerase
MHAPSARIVTLALRDSYRYFTQADTAKIRAAGYAKSFTTLEDGVHPYVQTRLQANLN